MELNGIELDAWATPATGAATFDLPGATMAGALDVDCSTLVVTGDDGSELARLTGYSASMVERIEGGVRLWATKDVDGTSDERIEALEKSVDSIRGSITRISAALSPIASKLGIKLTEEDE